MPRELPGGDMSFEIPEVDDQVESDGDLLFEFGFVDPDNDHVVMSRRGCFIDRSRAIGPYMGLRLIDSPEEADDVWDSEKDDWGNAGIAPFDVLLDGTKW